MGEVREAGRDPPRPRRHLRYSPCEALRVVLRVMGRINVDRYTGQDATRYKATIQETMQLLGVSEQAVRKRVRRGTLASEKGDDGRVYVYLSADQYANRDADGDADQVEGGYVRDAGEPGYSDLLAARDAQLEDLRERVESLERHLESEREANRENRRIIAGLTQRIPELEAPNSPVGESSDHETGESTWKPPGGPQSPEDAPETAEGSDGRKTASEEHTEPHSAATESATARKRPWWRRMFGG